MLQGSMFVRVTFKRGPFVGNGRNEFFRGRAFLQFIFLVQVEKSAVLRVSMGAVEGDVTEKSICEEDAGGLVLLSPRTEFMHSSMAILSKAARSNSNDCRLLRMTQCGMLLTSRGLCC